MYKVKIMYTARQIWFVPPLPFSALRRLHASFSPRKVSRCLSQEMGIDWSIREGYAWVEDKEHCEEYGRMLQADPTKARRKAELKIF